LAIVSMPQFVEGSPDRQAAAALHGRIDWKSLLMRESTDPGFDHSALSEFRHRLVADRASRRLSDPILDRLREAGLLVRPGGQHTGSTHVLAAVRRLENTAEHLRAALNAHSRWIMGRSPGCRQGFVLSVVHRELDLSAPAKAPAWGGVGLPGGVVRRGRHRGAALTPGHRHGTGLPRDRGRSRAAAERLPDGTAIDCVM
jgi:hypothetical protein